MKKLKDNGMLDAADVNMVFSNVEQILDLNYSLIGSLEGLEDLPLDESNTGQRFLSFVLTPSALSLISLASDRILCLSDGGGLRPGADRVSQGVHPVLYQPDAGIHSAQAAQGDQAGTESAAGGDAGTARNQEVSHLPRWEPVHARD